MTRWRFLGRVRLVAVSLGGAALLLLTVRSSVASLHRAHGSSDAPTIRDGDVFLVNRMAYDIRLPVGGIAVARLADPRRGDMVLFSMPGSGFLATKRVVAIPGEVVEVREGRLVVNGVPARYRPAGTRDSSGILVEERNGLTHLVIRPTTASASDARTIPADHFYVLGDNRQQSLDSRDFGPVPRSAIEGRLMVGSRGVGHR